MDCKDIRVVLLHSTRILVLCKVYFGSRLAISCTSSARYRMLCSALAHAAFL
jgi:hypothetical protein